MALFDFLGKGKEEATSTPTPTPVTTPVAQQVQQPVQAQQPVADFATMWEPKPAGAQQALNFDIPPEKLAEIANTINLSGLMTEELKTNLMAGGESAVDATLSLLNDTARQMYQANAVSTTKLVQAAYSDAMKQMEGLIDTRLKTVTSRDTIAAHEAYKDPAVRPLLDMVSKQVIQAFPDATAAEISTKVNEYMGKVATAFTPPKPEDSTGSKQAANVDWLRYIAEAQ